MSENETPSGRRGSPLPMIGIGLLLLVGIAVLAYLNA